MELSAAKPSSLYLQEFYYVTVIIFTIFLVNHLKSKMKCINFLSKREERKRVSRFQISTSISRQLLRVILQFALTFLAHTDTFLFLYADSAIQFFWVVSFNSKAPFFFNLQVEFAVYSYKNGQFSELWNKCSPNNWWLKNLSSDINAWLKLQKKHLLVLSRGLKE